jgi:hypothetical protein
MKKKDGTWWQDQKVLPWHSLGLVKEAIFVEKKI